MITAANAFLFLFSSTTLYLIIRYKIRVEIHVYHRPGESRETTSQPKEIREIIDALVGLGASRKDARAAAIAAYDPQAPFDASLKKAIWNVKN